MSLYYL